MSSNTTSASPPAVILFDLSSLPFELIKAILEQCDDYFTLHALRRTCKSFKQIIDNNPVSDRYLFRNRPLRNPALTPDELIKIHSLAQKNKAGDRDPWLLEGKPHIKVHPVLSRVGWNLDKEALGNAGIEIYVGYHYLTMKNVPQALYECATCPPVSTLQVELDLSNNYGYCGGLDPELELTSTSSYQITGQPVLVRDVIGCLLENSRDLFFQYILYIHHYECRENFHSSADFKTGCPSVTMREDGLLHLAFGSQAAS